jgi:hypothetical protein
MRQMSLKNEFPRRRSRRAAVVESVVVVVTERQIPPRPMAAQMQLVVARRSGSVEGERVQPMAAAISRRRRLSPHKRAEQRAVAPRRNAGGAAEVARKKADHLRRQSRSAVSLTPHVYPQPK